LYINEDYYSLSAIATPFLIYPIIPVIIIAIFIELIFNLIEKKITPKLLQIK